MLRLTLCTSISSSCFNSFKFFSFFSAHDRQHCPFHIDKITCHGGWMVGKEVGVVGLSSQLYIMLKHLNLLHAGEGFPLKYSWGI